MISVTAEGGQKGRKQLGKGLAGSWFFCCCFQSAISLMKWSKMQGDIAMDGNVRKQRHGCRLLPTRSAGYHISISLVKSDWKLQQKTEAPPAPFPAAPPPFVSVSLRLPRRLEKLEKLIPVTPLFYNGGISPAYCG